MANRLNSNGSTLVILAVAFAGAVGCTSISSTFLHRLDDDAMVGISNGQAGINQHARPFKGIPVTLKIPTHLDISIVETLMFVDQPESGKLTHLPLARRHLDVLPEVQVSDKVFTVDVKRPAAGSLDYEIEFQDGKGNPQYFSQVGYHVVDQTIRDITAVVANLKPIGPLSGESTGRASATKQKEGDGVVLEPMVRTVAWKRFDLNAPDFEDQVLFFVNQHVNDCHSCGVVQTQEPMSLEPECVTAEPAPIVRVPIRKIQ